jgi:hypothetical protein
MNANVTSAAKRQLKPALILISREYNVDIVDAVIGTSGHWITAPHS